MRPAVVALAAVTALAAPAVAAVSGITAVGCSRDEPRAGPAVDAGPGGDAGPGAPRVPVALATLNIASGAGDRYRTLAHRAKQGAFLAATGAEVLALQEVDLGTDRSGNADTAAAVAAGVAQGFGSCAFAVEAAPHFSADGTRLARCAAGAIVFGIGFRADDPFSPAPDGTPSGIMDVDESIDPKGVDRGADAWFGNAAIVRAPWEVAEAYTVALPSDAAGSAPRAELLAALAKEARDEAAIAELAAHNLKARTGRSIEPRSALVVRLRAPGTDAGAGTGGYTVITTHLESAGTAALRAAQLDAVVAIAVAERTAASRRVVVMGDFNMQAAEAEPALKRAAFVVTSAAEIDQIWVDASLSLEASARVPTEGASDHAYAASARVR